MPEAPTYHILYMEDDTTQVRLVQRCLERKGYRVDVVFDGEAGLQCYVQNKYDAVIVDQTMPLRSGLEVIRDMAGQGPLPPTIMVTGTGNEQVAVEAMKLGVSDYLVKDLEGGFVRLLPVALERAINQHRLVEEKKQAEEKLALFRSFAEASAQGFGIGDFELKVKYVNPALCRILGESSPEAIIGKNYTVYYPPDLWSVQRKQIREAILHHRQWTGEMMVTTAGGAATPVLQCIFPICNDQGEPIYYGTTVTDISERKQLEQELVQAQKLEAIGQLAAGIAHEINTPIQYIGDNACFLQDAFNDFNSLLNLFESLLKTAKEKNTDEEIVHEIEATQNCIDLDYLTIEIPKAIQQSLEGVERVASIVGAMKEFSHPGRKEKQAVDLNKAIESTLTISRNEWKYVADIVTDLEPALPSVYCLPTEINQVMLNIVVNAAHAVGQALRENKKGKGTITVRTKQDGDWVEIRIEDTGTGIPEAIRSRVFDPFFTTKDVGQGSGQGLAIARSIIVDHHGGTIRFESAPTQGTAFIIRLPIDTRTTKQRESTQGNADPSPNNSNIIYASLPPFGGNNSTKDTVSGPMVQ